MPRTRRLLAVLAAAIVLTTTACSAPAEPAPTRTAAERSTASPTPSPTPTDPAVDAVQRMSTAQQAATVVMGHIPTADPSALRKYMSAGLGGFILMGSNVPATPEQLRTVTQALVVDDALPPLIAVDQEGGDVSRLGWDELPAGRTLKSRPAAETRAAFTARGKLLADTGITVNFGIVADIPRDASSFIHRRALGTDPAASAERVTAAVQAEAPFVASTLKHFPGHGAAPGDSHHGIPSTAETLEQWRNSDALPFVAGIEAGAPVLMFGHLAYTAVDSAPASLSARWHQIARDELGFDGVVITDDLGMLGSSGVDVYRDPVRNAVTALTAGSDMVLMIAGSTPDTAGQMVDGIVRAVADGTLPAERLQEAAERVVRLRMQLATR
ncbi:glycoside hydrolase family 3 N-terminal domain-containing protein [Microbacterium sp.]|uniref:glycoside hydrolase family 3 N-terminal domain-containing protein n=1 Tax=Microbacterium sp. TaxID=51671 RepID=UPI002811BBDD|nr:glycoside hydrolase family 3 N-terminal domain-containing protein [Microbacterium sp.]